MLVLSRKLNEIIRIGKNIRIIVVDIDRGKIRLGIDAPRNLPIYREELLANEAIQRIVDQSPDTESDPTIPATT